MPRGRKKNPKSSGSGKPLEGTQGNSVKDALNQSTNPKKEKMPNILGKLTNEEKEVRFKALKDIHYIIGLHLKKGNDYSGIVIIKCKIDSKLKELFLDWSGSEVTSILYNQSSVILDQVLREGRILIPIKYQEQGINTFSIEFKNNYSKNGFGLHHFTDENDKNEYVYTHLEAFFANKVYPCFDQPNLKANFTLVTLTPPEWKAISSMTETKFMEVKKISALDLPNELKEADFLSKETIDEGNVTIFPKTGLICTYIFPIIAGPYEVLTNQDTSKNSIIPPMKIYCRKSLKKFVTEMSQDLFDIMKYGINFYSEFFGYKFPFEKYDQIFVPEFSIGGMENVGAVTFNERYIFKETPTINELMNFQLVALHELSHMWFGDLVSIKWWNDLWLKESFATFMCYLALSKAEMYETSKLVWQNFIGYKQWAFKMDQLPSTHPIFAQIDNTEMAQNLFDGITYSKGASILHQLFYLIGENAFKKGLKEYFEKYQNKNADMIQFKECLQNAIESDKSLNGLPPLKDWINEWIHKSGMNIIKPEIKINDGKITNFKIIQEKTKYGNNCLRVHYIDIALIYNDSSVLKINKIKVENKEETIITELNSKTAPFIILLNCTDTSFCKVRFDEVSLANLKNNFHLIKDNLMRIISLRALNEYVRDNLMNPPEYIKIAQKIIENENEIDLLKFALETSNICVSKFLSPKYKLQISEEFFETMIDRMKIEKNHKITILIGRSLISFMNSKKHRLMMLHFFLSNDKVNFSIQKADRQSLLSKLVSDPLIKSEEKSIIMENEFQMPLDDEEKRRKLTCLCAMADPLQKKEYFNSFYNEKNNESDYELIAKMKGFWNEEDITKQEHFVNEFFKLIKYVSESKEWAYCRRCFDTLVPPIYSESIIKEFENFKNTIPKEQITLLKLINEHLDELERATKAQNLTELYFNDLQKSQN